jgi:hypothetical protein
MLGVPWDLLLGLWYQLLDEATPDPVGEPFQVTNVRLVPRGDPAFPATRRWEVQWDVSGNDSHITGYVVRLYELDPTAPPATPGPFPDYPALPTESRCEIPQPDIDTTPVGDRRVYLQPYVVALSADGFEHSQPGPARALSELRYQDNPIQKYSDPVTSFFLCFRNGMEDSVITSSPASHGTTAWTEEVCQCQGMFFDKPLSGCHLALRLEPPDTDIGARFTNSTPVPVARRLVAHVGFRDQGPGTNAVNVSAYRSTDGGGFWQAFGPNLLDNSGVRFFDLPVGPLANAGDLWVDPKIHDTGTSAPEPIVFVGLRFVDP